MFLDVLPLSEGGIGVDGGTGDATDGNVGMGGVAGGMGGSGPVGDSGIVGEIEIGMDMAVGMGGCTSADGVSGVTFAVLFALFADSASFTRVVFFTRSVPFVKEWL